MPCKFVYSCGPEPDAALHNHTRKGTNSNERIYKLGLHEITRAGTATGVYSGEQPGQSGRLTILYGRVSRGS